MSIAAFKKFKTKDDALQFIGNIPASSSKSTSTNQSGEANAAKLEPSCKRELSENNESAISIDINFFNENSV